MNTTTPLPEGKIREYQVEKLATARAQADPLPGPLAHAFGSGHIKIAEGIYVRKMVASDYPILKSLDSPIFRMMTELANNPDQQEEVAFTDQEEWEMCYQFTTPIRTVREVMAQGREAFAAAAREEIADRLSAEVVKLITPAIMEQLKRNITSAVQYHAEMKEDGQVSFLADTNPAKAKV